MKKLLSLLLVAGMLFSVTACGGNTAEKGETTAAKTEAVTEEKIAETENEEYVIVIDKSDEGAVSAAERMTWQMKEVFGTDIKVIDQAEGRFVREIVLGKTNRGEKIDTSKLIRDEFEIKTVGDKVFIDGASADGLYGGAVKFLSDCTDENGLKIEDNFSYKDTSGYPIGKLTVNGNDISKYTVLYSAGAGENTVTGANDIAEYIEKACGAKLPVKEGSDGDFAIIVKEETVPVEGSPNNGIENFSVKSVGNNIVITGGERGAMYGCYDFLEDVIGWCFMTETQDYLEPVDSLDIKDLDYTESPVFTSRNTYWGTYLLSQDMKNKHKWWEIPWTGSFAHTFESLAPGHSSQYETQPCLSDPEVYDLMLSNVMKALDTNPASRIISVSQNDNDNKCECDKCLAAYEKYGAPSGLVIEFVNRIAEEVEKKYPDVLIHTFAYMYSLDAPTGIVPRDNVVVQACSIWECFAHPLECERHGLDDGDFAHELREWADIGCKTYIWDYNTNFSQNPYGMTNMKYEVLAKNIQLFADCNAIGVFSEGLHCTVAEKGEYDRLRAYLLAKLAWDPYMTEEEYNAHVIKFCKGFYGEGYQKMLDAMDIWQERDSKCHGIFDGLNDRIMNFMKNDIHLDLVNMTQQTKLLTVTKDQFENTDRTQLMYDLISVSIRHKKLTKDNTEESLAERDEITKALRNKFLMYGISFGNMDTRFPNMDTFEINPLEWKNNEDTCIVHSLEEVTVDYPGKNN